MECQPRVLNVAQVTIASEDLDDAATVWQLKVRCHAEVHVSVYRQRLVQEGLGSKGKN